MFQHCKADRLLQIFGPAEAGKSQFHTQGIENDWSSPFQSETSPWDKGCTGPHWSPQDQSGRNPPHTGCTQWPQWMTGRSLVYRAYIDQLRGHLPLSGTSRLDMGGNCLQTPCHVEAGMSHVYTGCIGEKSSFPPLSDMSLLGTLYSWPHQPYLGLSGRCLAYTVYNPMSCCARTQSVEQEKNMLALGYACFHTSKHQ